MNSPSLFTSMRVPRAMCEIFPYLSALPYSYDCEEESYETDVSSEEVEIRIYLNIIYIHISRVLLTLGGVCNGFPPFWHFFYYITLFRVPRRFLGAIKIATES